MMIKDCDHTVFSWYLDRPLDPVTEGNPWICSGCSEPVRNGTQDKTETNLAESRRRQASDLGDSGTTAERNLLAGFLALGRLPSPTDAVAKAQLHFLGSLAASVYEIRELMATEPGPIQYETQELDVNPVAVHQCQAADSEDRQCCMVQHYPESGHLARGESGSLYYFQDNEANYPAPGEWRATGYVGGASGGTPEPVIEGDDEQAPAT